MKRFRMEVHGMTCDSCNLHVERALERAGARDVKADWRTGEAVFDLDDGADPWPLAASVGSAGYGPGSVQTRGSEEDRTRLPLATTPESEGCGPECGCC